jgi:hypothetical protein
VGLSLKTKEQMEADIIEVLIYYRESSGVSMESRRQTMFARLVELVFKWCRDYPLHSSFGNNKKINPQNMGVELFEAVVSCVKQPIDSEAFLTYLKTAIKNAWKKHSLKYESGVINIPDKKLNILNKINQILEMAVHNKGKALTDNEIVEYLQHWLNVPEGKAREYLKLKNMITIHSLESEAKNGDDLDALNNSDISSPYLPDMSDDPQDINLGKLLANDKSKKSLKIREAIESVFMHKQQRARDCLRALYTVKYIDSLADFNGDFPFIDAVIVETYKKEGKLPNQYEIYLKYHPVSAKKSAEVSASRQLGEFEKELQKELRKFR